MTIFIMLVINESSYFLGISSYPADCSVQFVEQCSKALSRTTTSFACLNIKTKIRSFLILLNI